MRKLQFKSLTMQIWAIFTMVILVIILCLSIIYMYGFRFMDKSAKMQDLIVAHDILLESEFDRPMQFDALRNLRGVAHFICSGEGMRNIGGPGGYAQPRRNVGERQIPHFENSNIRYNLVEFANNNRQDIISGKRAFHQNFDGTGFIFVISEVGENSFFISFMPEAYDNSVMYYMLVIGALFIMVGFITAKIVASFISKPLSVLENFTQKIAARDWNEPIKLKNNDEIGRLAVSMNKMQEALRRADQEEKMFLQSISHDLKTPVMVIMSHADAIIDGVYVDNIEKTAIIIKDEAIRLNKKIKQLLYLNTLDYVLGNQSDTHLIEFDILLQQIVQKFEPIGGHLNWNLVTDKIQIKGNRDELIVAIENILDNALRYAKTEISISLTAVNKLARLEISNDGEFIQAENLNKIFDSMFAATLHMDRKGNFGLGLAISRKIISFFGGRIYAQNNEIGVSFIIEYPQEMI